MSGTTAIARAALCIAFAMCILASGAGLTARADGGLTPAPEDRARGVERSLSQARTGAALPPGFAADMANAYEHEALKGRSLEEAKRAMGSRRDQAVDAEIRSEIDATLRALPAGANAPR